MANIEHDAEKALGQVSSAPADGGPGGRRRRCRDHPVAASAAPHRQRGHQEGRAEPPQDELVTPRIPRTRSYRGTRAD